MILERLSSDRAPRRGCLHALNSQPLQSVQLIDRGALVHRDRTRQSTKDIGATSPVPSEWCRVVRQPAASVSVAPTPTADATALAEFSVLNTSTRRNAGRADTVDDDQRGSTGRSDPLPLTRLCVRQRSPARPALQGSDVTRHAWQCMSTLQPGYARVTVPQRAGSQQPQGGGLHESCVSSITALPGRPIAA